MSASPTTHPLVNTSSALPWWRFRMAWFVFALPALVVAASLVTAVIAWRHADQQVVDWAAKQGAQTGQGVGVGVGADAGALQPAVQARNHAATPKP